MATPPAFEPFDLSLSLGPGFVPWISAASRLGHVHGIVRRDTLVPAPADLLDGVYDYADAVRFAERDGLGELRRALGQLVFGDPLVLELFQATRGAAADRGRELLVRILASPHLAALPWELLPDPGKGHVDSSGEPSHLALAPDASIVRLARGRTYPVRTEVLEPPLNLLLLLSSPGARNPGDDELAFDIYEEKRSLLAELEPLVKAGLLCIDVEDQPTLQNLRRRIGAQRRGYHLFHYIGHAEPDLLILEDESGRCDKQSAGRFLEVLRLCPDLRLAVFAGCETARAARDPLALDLAAADSWRQILSLADRCVQESCPVVVGMQAVLPFRTERLFTRAFYQGIASGYPVTAAMRLARTATRGDRHVGGNLLDWSVPVLFVGGAEPGPLLDRSARGVEPAPKAQHVLRLGLRQGQTRFFARDIALRQAIDVLSGRAPERVLVVAGPPAVGKSTLIDRALEEIAGPSTLAERSTDGAERAELVLYVRLQDLAPELGNAATIAGMDVQAPLHRLCDLVAELLAGVDGVRREAAAGQTASQWWVRLMEALGSRRTVLVIDDLDGLAKAEESLARPIAASWLRQRVAQLGTTPAKPLRERLDHLMDHVRHSAGSTQSPLVEPNPLVSGLSDLGQQLGHRDGVIRGAVRAVAQDMLDGLDAAAADAQALAPVQLAAFVRLGAMRQALDEALRVVAERRSGVRLAVIADKLPEDFLELTSDQRFVLRLARLTWPETWRWIRRNLPGLLRHGEDYLERFWTRLGADLALWEELEFRALEPAQKAPDLEALVEAIAPRARTGNKRPGWVVAPRGQRPLRVAIAGPLISSPAELARAITRLAREHGVGGRVVTDEDDERGSLAVLVDVPSPFDKDGGADESAIVGFMRDAAAQQPDIVLLDYGYDVPLPMPGADEHERPWLARLRHRALLVAAGGNEGEARDRKVVSAPAVYPEVLAVGALNAAGQLQPYSEWHPDFGKPDVFMSDQLLGSALEAALSPAALQGVDAGPLGPGTHGSSFAAIHAVGAAILVWATLPELDPDELRDLLRRACTWVPPMPKGLQARPRALTVAAAVAEARREVIRRALHDGPCSLVALTGITGLAPTLVSANLRELIAADEVRCLTRGRFERYELVRRV